MKHATENLPIQFDDIERAFTVEIVAHAHCTSTAIPRHDQIQLRTIRKIRIRVAAHGWPDAGVRKPRKTTKQT
jgi:hypothetical protein